MKNILSYKSFLKTVALGLTLSACSPEFDAPTPSKGNADFTTYIAVGNSLTAGYADGGVYRESQLNSYPYILSQQFKTVGGGDFLQPLFSEAQANGSGYLAFGGLSNGRPVTVPQTTMLAVVGMGKDNKTPLYAKATGDIQNLGVPGIRVSDIKTAGYGLNNAQAFNPYFERLLSSDLPAGAMTYLDFVKTKKPTFFTCWLGNNDVLAYAASGGVAPITTDAMFRANYKELLAALTANGAKGVVANIPNITLLPYFNTVTVAAARAAAGGAKLYIRTGTKTVREATGDDLIVLTADSIGTAIGRDPLGNPIAKGFHPFYPLNNDDVLDKVEAEAAVAAVTRLNTIIAEEANAKALGVVDANAFLSRYRTGTVFEGASMSAAYISGSLFSLDGIHLTPRGYAIAANEFIKVINSRYGASVPTVDVNSYRTIKMAQ